MLQDFCIIAIISKFDCISWIFADRWKLFNKKAKIVKHYLPLLKTTAANKHIKAKEFMLMLTPRNFDVKCAKLHVASMLYKNFKDGYESGKLPLSKHHYSFNYRYIESGWRGNLKDKTIHIYLFIQQSEYMFKISLAQYKSIIFIKMISATR